MKNIIKACLVGLLLIGLSCKDYKAEEMEETEAAIAVIDSVETEIEDIAEQIEDQAEEAEVALEDLEQEIAEESNNI